MQNLSHAAVQLRQAVQQKKTVIICCSCNIRYSGRAESFLDDGDRIIIIKRDATLLVHQPTGNTPINYMKPHSFHAFSLEQGVLTISSKNILLKEYMDITIKEVYNITEHLLEDHQELFIQGTEKDMADMIVEHPEMIERGFKPVSREEHTKHGFIDVFGYDKEQILTVIECKRFCADPKAVDQLHRYVRKIKETKGVKQVRGILAAPKISPKAQLMMDDLHFEFKQISPPKYLERYQKHQRGLHDFGY